MFLFAGGKDHDRLSAHQLVSDQWRKKVDKLDFVRLYKPTMKQVAEAIRMDPIASKYRVVVATEMVWDTEEDKQGTESLTKFFDKFPRDVVLILSTPAESPNTKNDLAQHIIRKGYWVVLTHVDQATAARLLTLLTSWEDEELISQVLEVVGTSPANLISFLRTIRLRGQGVKPEEVRMYLAGAQQGSVFELVDAVMMKDGARALNLLARSKIPMGQFIGALDRKLTSLLTFTAELKKGRTPREAMINLRMPGFLVHGLVDAGKRWTPSEILEVYPVLAEASVSGDKPGAQELLIAKLTQA